MAEWESKFWSPIKLVFIGQHDGNHGLGRVARSANRSELDGFQFHALGLLAVDVHPILYAYGEKKHVAAVPARVEFEDRQNVP